jgi:hypothetical protein
MNYAGAKHRILADRSKVILCRSRFSWSPALFASAGTQWRLWNGYQKSIASDIGLRLVSTGFVIAVACGMADVFGFGTEIAPLIPTFGIWQTIGVIFGEVVIGIGFLMLIPTQRSSRPMQKD